MSDPKTPKLSREEIRRIRRMGRAASLLVAMPPEDREWVRDRVRSDLARNALQSEHQNEPR